jgi:hypothetical protein
MLERQHPQLVSCVQELYQWARKAGSCDEPLPEDSNRYPSVHDILAALDLLEPKEDGSRDFETFNELVGSSQSDNNTPDSVLDGVAESQDHHDSTPDQSQSPSLPREYTTPFFLLGTSPLESPPRISSRPLSSSDESSTESSPAYSEHTTAPQIMLSRMPWQQTPAEYATSQARFFAALAAAPLNRSIYNNAPNVPVQYGSIQATTPSLSLDLDPRVIRQDYSSYQRQ